MKEIEDKLKPIFGIHPILEALKNDKTFDKVFVQKEIKTDIMKEIKTLCNKKGITLKYVPKEKLDRLTKANHQGVFGFLSPVEFKYLEKILEEINQQKEELFILVLDKITDVRNFGAIVRTAECVGVDIVIIPKEGTASINQDSIKTSAGAIFNVPICKVKNLTDAILLLKQYDFNIISATEKTTDTIYDLEINRKQNLGVIFGNEEKGISNQILKLSDSRAKLPLKGKIQSLNVSVAVGAFCYELLRKKM